jgi:nucleotidyltransferase/DNA polymerase involved in DNA repair
MRSLYACLFIPDFAAAVLLRERNRRTPPVAVFTGTPPNCFVYAANEPARLGGVRQGMPLAEAVARYGLAQGSRLAGRPAYAARTSRPLRDEVKGKGIKPYRLRPTAPVGTSAPACLSPQSGDVQSSDPAANRAARVSKRWQVNSQSTAIEQSRLPLPHGRGSVNHGRSSSDYISSTADLRIPGLQTRERSPEAETQTQQELIEMALTVSPRVEDAAAGMLIVDLAGMPDPHGSASQLAHGAEKLDLPANVGVSANRFVAIAAARTQVGVTHIFPGQEAGFLSVLPLDTLPLDTREQEVFARWGLHTVGDLARLPEDSLVARFGTRGEQLSQLARGQQDAVMRPYEPPPALEETTDLDWQIGELEPLAFLLSGLLERLCVKLQGHNLAAAEIRVALKLADGSRYERAVAMSHPLADPRTLLTLVRIDLAAHPPGNAVEGITVAAQPSPRRLTQFSLFDPVLPSPEKLAVTLARLTHLVGPGRVGAPAVPDTHRPGAFGVKVFQVATGAPASRSPQNGEAPEFFFENSEPRRKTANGNNGIRKAQHGLLALPSSKSGKGYPRQRLHAVSASVPQRSLPTPDTKLTLQARPESAGTPTSVLVFPEPVTSGAKQRSQVSPALPASAASAKLDDDRRGLLAKVVVFPSPFHGERQVGAPVATPSAARRTALVTTQAAADSSDGSTDQPINRSAVDNRSAVQSRSTAHAFRCFRPSAEAEVLLRGRLPVYVDSFEVRGPVCARAGPWQVCGEWWAAGWNYEEWDVEVDGRLYRICCEMPARRWYVTGAYD